jgi:ABC-type nitrate/sulfonate/bicarbonate transport system, permease component
MVHVSTPSSSILPVRKSAELAWVERLGWAVLSLATLVALWAVSAQLIGSRHLPGPEAVLEVLQREAANGTLWSSLFITLFRVAAAFTVAMFIGAAIGIAIGSTRPQTVL